MPATKPEERVAELEHELSALLRVEKLLTRSGSGNSVALSDEILKQALGATKADAGTIYLKDKKTGRLVCVAALGEKADAIRHYSLAPGRGIAGAVAESGRPILTEASVDPRHDKVTAMAIDFPVSGILCAPISDEGTVVGVMELLMRAGSPHAFDDGDLRLLTLMAGQAARAIEAARAVDARIRAERLDAMRLVIKGVVHDVRNPLTFINGYAELLGGESGGEESVRIKARDAIYRSVDDINGMLLELADFAAGEDTLHRKTADLHEIVADVVRLFQPRAETAKIKIHAYTRGDGRCEVDAAKIRRAVGNLVRNAIEATPSGGAITVCVSRRGRYVRAPGKPEDFYLWVRDTGKGVPPDVMNRLFEPFVTQGKKGGTGLGLSICRRFAEAHGGEVGCRTREGKGTRFIVRLPPN